VTEANLSGWRILHVIQTLSPKAGGPPAVAARLAAAQAALGNTVTILSYLTPEERSLVEIATSKVPGMTKVQLEFVPKGGRFENFFATQARRRLRQLLPQTDVIHIHNAWDPILFHAARMARNRKFQIPYVVRPAGALDVWSLQQKRWKKKLAMLLGYRKMYDRAAYLHVLNKDERRLIADNLSLCSPLRVIPNGVFLEEISPLPEPGTFTAKHPVLQGRPFILFLSRLHYKKGLDYLGASFAQVAQRNQDVHLVVVGPDDGAKASFLQQIEAAGLQNRVHVIPGLYGPDKLAALRDATCFCLPSRQEGFSVAITEALACGVPAVVSDACHFPEVQTEGAGFVVPLEIAAVAEALLKILDDAGLRQRMSEAGKMLIRERFTWPRIAEMTLREYKACK